MNRHYLGWRVQSHPELMLDTFASVSQVKPDLKGEFSDRRGIFSTSIEERFGGGMTMVRRISFVVVQAARSAGRVGDNVFGVAIAASLLSIFLALKTIAGESHGRLHSTDHNCNAAGGCLYDRVSPPY